MPKGVEHIVFTGRAILLDIEGTTSSIAFVGDVLFPYARQEMESFLRRHWNDPEVERAKTLLAQDVQMPDAPWLGGAPPEQGMTPLSAAAYLLMDADAKATGLKALQGLIWREGYDAGRLCSHVYPDVPPALADWTRRDVDVRIYSSGSVTAQQAYFANTEAGDLSHFFRGYYDTTIGPKRVAESYRRIAADMKLSPGEVLFLSDVVAELDAAAEAGMQTGLVVRPGNAPVPERQPHATVTEFGQLHFNS
jgi:enolase-phosphatase E1